MDFPKVSCIMPTCNRRQFAARAIKYFREQTYPNKELVIVDDGSDPIKDLLPPDESIKHIYLKQRRYVGIKRNLAIEAGSADIILHWDDDDWHARHRIQYQVKHLLANEAEICGIPEILFFDLRSRRLWLYQYPVHRKMWLAGGTLCYRESFWRGNKFPDVKTGSDTRFVWQGRLDRAFLLPDITFYVAMIHPGNTSPKSLAPPYWKRCVEFDIKLLLKADWPFYEAFSNQSSAFSVKSEM